MRIPRRLAILLVLLFGAPGAAAVAGAPERAKTPPAEIKAPAIPDMAFYLARGDADACGRGCSEWIAAEGRIDADAAQRLRRLLAKLGARRLPIYFHSPGGSVIGSLALGRLIRERKLQAGVASTIPAGCDRDKPWERSCQAQKRSGRELGAEFDPTRVMCNSACVFALAGAIVRVVPPGIKLGIHDVGFDTLKRPMPAAVVARARMLAHAQIREYLREMGIEHSLYAAIVAVPHDSKRFLEREELARFGIDRREFGETSWHFVEHPKAAVAKVFFARVGGVGGEKPRYRTGFVRLDCPSGQDIRVLLAREHVASDVSRTRPFSIGIGGRRFELHYPTFSAELDTRSTWLSSDAFGALGDAAKFELAAMDLAGTDEPAGNIALSMDGFSRAYAKLQGTCREAPAAGQLRVGTSTGAPRANPNCRPGGDTLKCLQGDTGVRASAPTATPNVLPSAPPANVVQTVPIRPDAQATPARAPPTDAVLPASSAAVQDWKRALLMHIARHKHYPPAANGEEGTATVAFRIDRDGHLLENRIVRSSGSAVLDAETLALVKRAQPFPAPPADLPDAQLSLVVPLHYASPLAHRQ